MTNNYSKSGVGQQSCSRSGSLDKQHWNWEGWGPRGFYFSGSGIHIPSYFDSIPFILIRTGDVMTQSNTYGRIIKHLGWLLAADLVVFTREYWLVHVTILSWGVGITTVLEATRVVRSSVSFNRALESCVAWQSGADSAGILTVTLLAKRSCISHWNTLWLSVLWKMGEILTLGCYL